MERDRTTHSIFLLLRILWILRLAVNRMARAIGQASCTFSYLDNDLHGSGFRTSKTSHVSLVSTLCIPRPAATVMEKGQFPPHPLLEQ